MTILPSSMEVLAGCRDLCRSLSGATAIEYALIASLLSIVVIVAVAAVGGGVGNYFNGVADQVFAAIGSG